MDSNDYPQRYSSYDCLLAVDAFTSVKTDYHNAFDDLKQYQQVTKDWLFGYLSFDLKNDVEHLHSNNFDGLAFPDLFFFQPKKVFLLKENQVEIQYLNMCDDEVESDLEEIRLQILNFETQTVRQSMSSRAQSRDEVQQRISKENYLEKVSKVLEHIHRGDIYEANFCIEFLSKMPSSIHWKSS